MAGVATKWLKYILITAGILLFIPIFAYVTIQIPGVQTIVVRHITNVLSEKLNANISIGRVDYRFFNRLALSEVLFLDNNSDTLLHVERLTAGLRKFDNEKKAISLGKIILTRPEVSFITDSTGIMNLTRYLDKFRGDKDTTKPGLEMMIDRVDINNGSFSLINRNGKERNSGIDIDLSNLGIKNINGTVENLRVFNDTVSLSVYDLTLTEKSGFTIKRMNSNLTISGKNMLFETALINCDTSVLNIRKLSLTGDSADGFRNFIEKVRLDVLMDKSIISTTDLGYFVPIPERINESVTLSGRFNGTIAEFRGRNIKIAYGNKTFLDFDFNISGLPRINDAFIYLGFNEFITNAADFPDIVLPGGENLNLPEFLYKLGDISFDGSFSGFTTDFVTYGEFTTSRGGIRTDISLRPEKKNRYRMQGLMNGYNIDLKELTGSDIMGKLNIHANVDGYASSIRKLAGNITGQIDSVEINGYNYRNIDLRGSFTDKTWDGSINIVDENIRFDLLGMFNFNDTLPEFDFTFDLSHADLHNLKIDKKDSTSSMTMLLTSNFKGNSIDNLDGEIKLVNSDITKNGKTINLHDFLVRTFSENNQPVLSLQTDFVNAAVKGNYNFEGLKHFIRNTMASLMPSLGRPEKNPEEIKNHFNFEVNFGNTDKINDFFRTGLLLAENSYIKGSVSSDSSSNIEGKADFLSFKNIRFSRLNFIGGTSGSHLNADLSTSSLLLPGATILRDFRVNLETVPDTFYVKTYWDNKEQILNQGLITAMGSVSKRGNGIMHPVLKINIDSSIVFSANNKWTINRSSVVIDSGSVAMNHIYVGSGDKFYNVTGTISRNPSDTLHLLFKGIDISPLNHLGQKARNNDTTGIRMDLKGRINGNIALTGVYDNLMLESDILLNDFSMLGSEFGNVAIKSEFDNNRKVVDINANNNLHGIRMFDVSGFYDPGNRNIDVGLVANNLSVKALTPLLRSFASEISGQATGRLRLTGTNNNLVLAGAVKADNVKIKIDYLQTRYTVNDSVRFNRNGIVFTNVRFADEEGRFSSISGMVRHSSFKDYRADLTINMGNNFLVLNTQIKDNPSFYGRVYASGVTRIKTSSDLLSFDISARTGNNTRFFIPLTNELSVGEYSFVNFITPGETGKSEIEIKKDPPKKSGIDLNIDLTVTPDAVAEIIFDEKVGDKITGNGSGLLNVNMNPKGDLRITGDYTIERGTYLFTLGNIINKRFDVANGGRISFNGDLDDAEIELKAIYQKFSASLYPVTQDVKDQEKRYAVEPQLLLSGRLFNPKVKFEINLPNADEQARTSLRDAIASDEVLNRQFMYLLVTNSFYSEQSSATAGYSSPGASAFTATTFEMLFNQMSNWISQINENVNLGLNYRPGSGNSDLDPDEVQLAFETQMFDDRVILNGNFDYRTNSGSTERLTGDFEAELKITDRFRFKAFNRFNDTYSGRGPYTQGIGIFYRENFEKFSDLFRRKKTQDAKKEEDIKLTEK